MWEYYICILPQLNINDSNTDSSFVVVDLNWFLSPRKSIPTTQENKYFREIFLFYLENVCYVYSLDSPYRGDSNEYTQQTIIL